MRCRFRAESSQGRASPLPEARATLASADAARGAVADARDGLRGTVALGILQSMRPPGPSPAALLRTFGETHPLVDVTVGWRGTSNAMAGGVAAGTLDLSFVSTTDAMPGVDLALLWDEPVDFACSPGHPLAGRPFVTLDEVARETFADLSPGFGVRMANDRAVLAAGLTRSVRREVDDVITLLEFVREGPSVGLVPRSIAAKVPGLMAIPIDSGAPRYVVAVASPSARRMSAASRALLDHIVSAAASASPASATTTS